MAGFHAHFALRLFERIVSFLLVFVCPVATAGASPPSLADPIGSPRLCTGYDPSQGSWHELRVNPGIQEEFCQNGAAMIAHEFVSGRWWHEPDQFAVEGSCCPLPAGVLTDRHTFVKERCPDQAVVTGARNADGRYLLRCTEIDTTRFTLGPERSGWKLGWDGELVPDLARAVQGTLPQQTTWSRIPLGLRYGVLRTAVDSWSSGCIGSPWGSVLVARTGKSCEAMSFRNILVKSDIGTVPLATFPDCERVTDPYTPDARCEPASPSSGRGVVRADDPAGPIR